MKAQFVSAVRWTSAKLASAASRIEKSTAVKDATEKVKAYAKTTKTYAVKAYKAVSVWVREQYSKMASWFRKMTNEESKLGGYTNQRQQRKAAAKNARA